MPVSAGGIFYEEGGRGEPLVVLLHGLSGAASLWRGVTDILDARWPGRWIAPDFRGHGRSPHAERYGVGLHGADIADLAGGAGQVYLVGHSMGGQCAMALASGWFGFSPAAAIAIGVAVDWDAETRARIDRLAATPARLFETRDEALQRFVRVNGLDGLVDPYSDIAAVGVRESEGKWRLCADNRAAMVASAGTREVYAAAVAPVVLMRGENDALVSAQEHLSLDSRAVTVPGCGHNVHVERPEAVWQALRQAAGL